MARIGRAQSLPAMAVCSLPFCVSRLARFLRSRRHQHRKGPSTANRTLTSDFIIEPFQESTLPLFTDQPNSALAQEGCATLLDGLGQLRQVVQSP